MSLFLLGPPPPREPKPAAIDEEKSSESEQGEPGEIVHLTKARPRGPQRRPQSQAVGEYKIEVHKMGTDSFVFTSLQVRDAPTVEPQKAQAPIGVGGPPNLMMMGGASPVAALKKPGASTPEKKSEDGSAEPASPLSPKSVHRRRCLIGRTHESSRRHLRAIRRIKRKRNAKRKRRGRPRRRRSGLRISLRRTRYTWAHRSGLADY